MDSLVASSVVAERHKQLDDDKIQDQELVFWSDPGMVRVGKRARGRGRSGKEEILCIQGAVIHIRKR